MDQKSIMIYVAITVIATISTAFSHATDKKQSEFDQIWGTATKQEEFDGIPLPENSDVSTVTQMTPAVVKIGQRYGSPYPQSLGKKKIKPLKKDELMDHLVEASLMSGGSLISLGTLALIMMAGKALMLALGAVVLTLLNSGWISTAHKLGSSSTVYEVIAKPQISHGHSYSAEVHYEPYTSQSSLKDYGHR